MLNCKACPLHGTTTIVKGYGSKSAKIIVVAESPGETEERKGLPLVGRSGRVFDNILRDSGLDRGELFIINCILCRPPKNNIKSAEAKEALKICPYINLFPTIKEVNPRVIITLGNTPHKLLFGSEGIKKKRGNIRQWNGYKVVPTLHPAYLLRGNMYMFDTVVRDFKLAKRVSLGKKTDVKTVLIDTMDKFNDLIELLLQHRKVAFDVEATGLDVRKDEIIGCSFAVNSNTGYYVQLRDRTAIGDRLVWCWNDKEYVINKLRSVLENDGIIKSIHNASYDYQIVKNDLGININNFIDSLIPAQLIDENTSNKLKDLIKIYPDLAGYDDELENIKTKLRVKDYSYIPREIIYKYAAKDAVSCFRITNRYISKLRNDNELFDYYTRFKKPLTPILIEMEEIGLKIDVGRLPVLKKEYESKIESIRNDIYDSVGYRFNINSDQQLADLLFDKMKLPVLERSKKTGAPSTDKKVLKELLEKTNNKVIEKILEHNKLYKLYSTYIVGMSEFIDENNVVHSHFSQTTTVTGRLASQRINCQNVAGNKDILDLFISREGYTFIYGDLKQAEIRGAAAISGDKNLLNTCLGKDIYCDLGSIMFKKQIKKGDKERDISKTLILATMYQMGVKSLAKSLGLATGRKVTESEAREYQRIFFDICKDLKIWITRTIKFAKRHGYVRNPFGRVRHLPYINSDNLEIAAFSERAAVNSPIQSMVADIINYNLCRISNYFKHNNIPARVAVQVHDMLMLECRDDYVDDIIPIFRELITKNVEPVKIPLQVDIKVGKKWGSLKEI